MSTGTEAHAPTAGEYIVHHLTHLNSTGHAQTAIIDWSVWNLDTLFFSIGLGIVTLARASGRPIGPMDTLIAAHALSLDVTIVTHNLREFSRIASLRVEDWLAR